MCENVWPLCGMVEEKELGHSCIKAQMKMAVVVWLRGAVGRKGWHCRGLRPLMLPESVPEFDARWSDPKDVAVCLIYFPPLKLP